VLQFRLHYHPEVLVLVLRSRFGVYGAEPNYGIGDGDDIEFSPITECYTFSRGWGDCPAGCIDRHYWDFVVIGDRTVLLVAEYGTPLP
jgi:hypothetical protein